ncbi:unnamed protein product [Effrenium voratum]|uniref:Uncharacterized protein n=1 Tax=Effrenium voratum TaxID=2562239 RepID=A0AA36HJ95_9DINO|nr:unnamed protein product [Effrenium voratum]
MALPRFYKGFRCYAQRKVQDDISNIYDESDGEELRAMTLGPDANLRLLQDVACNYFIVGLQTESAEEAAVTMSRRQRRRAYEVRYWDNVLRNALALADRKRKRRERAEEEIFAFYADMVKDEMAETKCADAVFQITEKPSTSEQAKEDVRGCAEKQIECFLWDLRVVLERRKFAMQYENCVTPKCSAGSGTEDAAPGGIRIPLKMMAGPRWPREPYMKKPCSTPMTPEEIKDMWARNAKLAANQGTWTHLQCECILNGGAVADGAGSMEMQLFRTFLLGSPKLIAYRTEWAIFGERERLAGTIDFVARNDRGELVLYDWKRTKQLRHKYVLRVWILSLLLDADDDKLRDDVCGGCEQELAASHFDLVMRILATSDACISPTANHVDQLIRFHQRVAVHISLLREWPHLVWLLPSPLDTYASASSFNARLSETLMLFELLENGHFKSFALVCYTLYHNELAQEDWLQHYLDAAQEFPRWQDQAVRCLMLVHLLRLPQRPTRLEHLCASNALPPIAEETAEPDDVLGGGLNDSQNTQDTFRQELSQEMQSRLEGVEASPISVKRERLDPQGAAASSSQHAGAPHETKKEEPKEDDDGAPAEPEISVDTATWSVLQKRRLLPGAARLHGVPDTIVRLCVAALAVFRVYRQTVAWSKSF